MNSSKKINAAGYFFIIMLIGTGSVYAQRQGIGIRIGVPFGLTYKKYLPDNKALEFGFGTAPRGWEFAYYRNSFEFHYPDYEHISHRVTGTIYLQGRYLIHNPISTEGIKGKVDWYWGVGLLFKAARVDYRYRNEAPPFDEVFRDERTDVDFGPEGIAGAEYTFQNAPLSAFAEMSLMLELADRLTLRVPIGFGLRYNF